MTEAKRSGWSPIPANALERILYRWAEYKKTMHKLEGEKFDSHSLDDKLKWSTEVQARSREEAEFFWP